MFTDEEFEDACGEAELQTPELSDWEHFSGTQNQGINIYRQYNDSSGLYSYKVYGEIDVLPETCADVFVDYEYRTKWDSYVVDLYPVGEGDKRGLYWQIKFPFPLSNRDYVYVRERRELDLAGRHVWVILSRNSDFQSVPEKKGVVRVTDFQQSLVLTSNGRGGTKAFMRYYDNPGGMIPAWLINWAAKTGVPSFLDQMEQACLGYKDYKVNS